MSIRARKILLGCGGGCLTLMVLSVGACISFNIWIKQPGPVLEPTRLLLQDTTGYVEWSVRMEDPGTEAFVNSLAELGKRLQDQAPRRGPAWLDQILKTQRGQRDNAAALRVLLPAVAAWTVRPGPIEDTDLHLFTASVKGIGNQSRILDLMLRFTFGLKHSVKHNGERLYTTNEGAGFIRNNTFYLTNSETNARLIVDRMRGEIWETEREPTELELRLDALPDERPLRGLISNGNGELWRVWRSLAGLKIDTPRPEAWNAIRGATLTGGFAGETAFAGTINFQGPDAAWARANADELLTLLRSGYDRGHLPVELEGEAIGDSIRVSYSIDDVFAMLDEM